MVSKSQGWDFETLAACDPKSIFLLSLKIPNPKTLHVPIKLRSDDDLNNLHRHKIPDQTINNLLLLAAIYDLIDFIFSATCLRYVHPLWQQIAKSLALIRRIWGREESTTNTTLLVSLPSEEPPQKIQSFSLSTSSFAVTIRACFQISSLLQPVLLHLNRLYLYGSKFDQIRNHQQASLTSIKAPFTIVVGDQSSQSSHWIKRSWSIPSSSHHHRLIFACRLISLPRAASISSQHLNKSLIYSYSTASPLRLIKIQSIRFASPLRLFLPLSLLRTDPHHPITSDWRRWLHSTSPSWRLSDWIYFRGKQWFFGGAPCEGGIVQTSKVEFSTKENSQRLHLSIYLEIGKVGVSFLDSKPAGLSTTWCPSVLQPVHLIQLVQHLLIWFSN